MLAAWQQSLALHMAAHIPGERVKDRRRKAKTSRIAMVVGEFLRMTLFSHNAWSRGKFL